MTDASFSLRSAKAALAALLIATANGGCTMAEPCFTRVAGVVLPDPVRVRANLTHGTAGQAIYDAVMAGDTARVTDMLRARPDLSALRVTHDAKADFAPEGQVGDLLTFAVTSCNAQMVATLLDLGLSPNGAQPGVPLSFALLADQPTMAELLLQRGASPDPQKVDGGVDLVQTIAPFRQRGAIRMLLRHGLDLDWVGANGLGHLDTVVQMEQFAMAEDMIAAGANPWRIGMGGNMAVQGIAGGAILPLGPDDAAAKERLIAALRRPPSLPWPPPAATTVREKVLAGEWPTPAMRIAGMVTTPQALDDMRRRAAD